MKSIIYPLPFALLLLFSMACGRDEVDKDNISLTAVRDTMDRNKITLNWSLSYHNDFVKYHLVRSINPNLSDVVFPLYNLTDSIYIFRLEDQTTSQHIDEERKPGFDLYYKLYVERENGEVVSSPTVQASSLSNIVDIQYAHSAEIPGTTYLLLSSVDGRVVKYDYVQDKILHEIALDDLDYPIIRVGDAGNGMEVFVRSISGQRLYVLNINDLSIKATTVFGFDIFDLTTSPKGFLFLSKRNNFTDKYIYSIRRADWELRDSILPPTSLNKNIIVTKANDNTLFCFSNLFCMGYLFDSDGFFTGDFIDGNVTLSGDLKADISVSPSGTQLIATTAAPVVDQQLEMVSLMIDITPPSFINLESPFYTFENESSVYMHHSEENSLVLFDIFTGTYSILYSQLRPRTVYRTETQVIAVMENTSSYPSKTEVLVLNK